MYLLSWGNSEKKLMQFTFLKLIKFSNCFPLTFSNRCVLYLFWLIIIAISIVSPRVIIQGFDLKWCQQLHSCWECVTFEKFLQYFRLPKYKFPILVYRELSTEYVYIFIFMPCNSLSIWCNLTKLSHLVLKFWFIYLFTTTFIHIQKNPLLKLT